MNIQEFLQLGIKTLNTEDAKLDVELLLCSALDLSRSELLTRKYQEIDEEVLDILIKNLKRRYRNEPIAYILNNKTFFGCDFFVDKEVLIPRGESELLVYKVIQETKKHKLFYPKKITSILELGVGSGALIISLVKNIKYSWGFGIDISKQAVDIARKNQENLDVRNISFEIWDMLDSRFYDIIGKKFDIIISNPPYIPRKDIEEIMQDVVEYEPHIALFGGEDGLDYYRFIAKNVWKCLEHDGLLALEVGYDQAYIVQDLLISGFEQFCAKNRIKQDYLELCVEYDYSGYERIILARRCR